MKSAMRIPTDAIIAPEKLSGYLLAWRARNDKSAFLARLGFAPDRPDLLEAAIREHIQRHDAVRDEVSVYGEVFVVDGELVGPIAASPIRSVWIRRSRETVVRFVTLKPRAEMS